jgi:hypothetical protein
METTGSLIKYYGDQTGRWWSITGRTTTKACLIDSKSHLILKGFLRTRSNLQWILEKQQVKSFCQIVPKFSIKSFPSTPRTFFSRYNHVHTDPTWDYVAITVCPCLKSCQHNWQLPATAAHWLCNIERFSTLPLIRQIPAQ